VGDLERFSESRIYGDEGSLDRSRAGIARSRFSDLVLCGSEIQYELIDFFQ
jgi:hypothetical protein